MSVTAVLGEMPDLGKGSSVTDEDALTPLRVGMVDDHRSPIWGIERVLDSVPDIDLVCAAPTVADVLDEKPLDVVLLDLRLDDGTTPRENVTTLTEHGIATVVYTSGEDPSLLRSAARAGVLGIVLKSADESMIVDAIRAASQGREVLTTEWAAAIDGDPELAAVDLSPQLQNVLALYASGETSVRVGEMLGVSAETVNEYLKRIRQKYADAGRPTKTKIDMFKRAIEDGWLPVPQRRRPRQPAREK